MNNIVVNDKSKKITWLSRNYLFAVTTMIVLLNVTLYAVHGSHLGDYAIRSNWGKFTVDNLFQALVNSYEHSNWQHCLLICSAFCRGNLSGAQTRQSAVSDIYVYNVRLYGICNMH